MYADIMLTCAGKDLMVVKKKLHAYLAKFSDWMKE